MSLPSVALSDLTPQQRERLLNELRAIDERLKDIDAMLTFLCKAQGIDPGKARSDG